MFLPLPIHILSRYLGGFSQNYIFVLNNKLVNLTIKKFPNFIEVYFEGCFLTL